jgi:uncharacterized Tic20 family protein
MNDVVDPSKSRQWAMFMHFSMLLNFLIPFGGVIAPIVMWQMKKDEMEGVDQHGKNIVNFLISMLIYSFISGILMLVVVGIFLLIALGIAGVVLPIIAGIKANNGEVWKYPLTIQILK